MADEPKGKCDWAPLTPAKSNPARCELNYTDKWPCQKTVKVESSTAQENGTQLYNHILHCEFGSDSTKASNEAKKGTPETRNQGKKRMRMKRHRPKVFDKTKTKEKKPSTPKPTMKPSTPKPRTPKRPKFVKENSLDKISVEPAKIVDRELVCDSNEKNCRRKLDLNIENSTADQNSSVCNEIESKPEVETETHEPVSRFSSLQVYTRRFKPNECFKNSRKLGPNCPRIFKKARMRRLKATVFDKFIIHVSTIRPTRNRRRTAMNEPMNLDQIVRDRNTKLQKLSSQRKKRKRKLVKNPSFLKCTSNLIWTVRRKRSKTPTHKRRDLSSFASDLSKLQLSRTSLSKAFTIRTKVTGRDELVDREEAHDECIQHLDKMKSIEKQELPQRNAVSCNESTQHLDNKKSIEPQELRQRNTVSCNESTPHLDNKKSIEQQELPQRNAVFCNESIQHLEKKKSIEQQELFQDDMISFNEGIQKCCTYFEDHMLGVEMDVPERNSNTDNMLNYQSQNKSESDVKTPSFIGPCVEEEENARTSQDYDEFTRALVDFASQMMEGLNIDDGGLKLVLRNQNGALIIPSKEKLDSSKKRQQLPKVDLDEETIRVFHLLMGNSESKEFEQEDDEKAKYWKEERALFEGRLDEFIAVMHLIQGDRRFSPWKGSVVDSVVGVFLTQNVSDHLSSSAFMSLAARYPPLSVSEQNGFYSGKSEIVIHDSEQVSKAAPLSDESELLLMIENGPTSHPSHEAGAHPKDENVNPSQTEPTPGRRKGKNEDKQETVNWDELRVKYSQGISKERTERTVDSVNWEAVRRTPVHELAKVIMERGMNNILAGRIKDFLDRLVRDHGSIDLEWLRDVPPDKAKEYLLSVPGLGLKSVECVRLLALQHQAFPVDVNISRVSTRFAWIPLQPLPEGVLIHLLNQYPDLDSVQQFLWPRLKHISHAKLYEAHYHLILFGKTICTKKRPNCGACPFRAKCKHYASMCASARPRLEGFHEENASQSSYESSQDLMVKTSQPVLPDLDGDFFSASGNKYCEPIIEIPESPVHECAPETDVDACTQSLEDIEDFGFEDEMLTLKLGYKDREDVASKALVTLRHEVATHQMPKLKYVERLRTVHHVYELPDSHPLLAGFDKREFEDPCPYLLAIWMTDETTNCSQEPKRDNNCQESTKCDPCSCSAEIVKYQNEQIVQGTILVPCRTANRGSFPLNGTYFQVNEVFADHESSKQPIDVPREWVWNLRRRALYCGTSVQSICRGMSMEEIAYSFKEGSICIRGFDKTSRGPKPLARRFHICKTRQVINE